MENWTRYGMRDTTDAATAAVAIIAGAKNKLLDEIALLWFEEDPPKNELPADPDEPAEPELTELVSLVLAMASANDKPVGSTNLTGSFPQ